MDELVLGALSLIVVCLIALAFLMAPCGNIRCYSEECADCDTGETHLMRAIDVYKSDFGVDEAEVTTWDNPFSRLFQTPGARLFLVLFPILAPLLLVLYFFFFTDAGHMFLGVGMVAIGIIIMLISVFAPFLYKILMPIGAIFFTMGVVMFTFS